ncbi:hypothetical protein [uncultured Thiodictyon sp.]|uniref:hypothetical protein n=1 Tax=uncultured Thiodictyon sp. TaxID=1846217 RepID=UPI0025DD4F69|nr:hypothetical protein [uncultured Thiodictyon sp.]
MKVLIIPEDFRKDQYMLKPIIEAMLTYLDRPKSKIKVLTDPLLGGIDQALNHDQIRKIIERYRGMVDLFLLCVDRDGNTDRRKRLDNIEKAMKDHLPSGKVLLAEHAWQEIEVWVLAGLDLPTAWSWQAIRAERDPKEKYFQPIAEQRGLLAEPGEGRKTLGLEAAQRYGQRLRQKCPDDILSLETRIAQIIGTK